MSSGKLFQLSGIALLLGSVLIILFSLLGFFTSFGGSFFFMFLGSLLVLMGFSAVLLHQSQRVGWVGLLGVILRFLAILVLDIGGILMFTAFHRYYVLFFHL